MRLSHTLPATLARCGEHLLANARARIDPAWIDLALVNAGHISARRRKLPADVVVSLVLGASLIAGMALDEVTRHPDGLIVLASDGVTIRTPDTPSNVDEWLSA
jgi:hypothetical protein